MTSMSAVISLSSPVPSIAAYNIRFLSLSGSSEQRAQHQRKLVNVQHVAKQNIMTAILETHVTGAKSFSFVVMLRARVASLFMAWRSLCMKPGLIISIPLSKQ